MDSGWTIREVDFGSPVYALMLAFREEHLRKPLGLLQSAEDVVGESGQFHIAALKDGWVGGTVVLKPITPALIKLRQMATAPHLRGLGLGAKIVRFAEQLASDRGFAEVEITSRVGVEGFYEKLGYKRVGDVFPEVGIPHVKMTRRIG